MKFSELLKSKKFWTLVSAVVAALAAFFSVSCASMVKATRSGIHCDTVKYEYKAVPRKFNPYL